MPYIAGSIYRRDCRQLESNLLLNQESELINSISIKVEGSTYTVDLKFGLYPMESSQELIDIAPDNRSFFCGRLFSKRTGRSISLPELDINAIKNSNGKELADEYWGRYILILLDNKGINVYRDPQGLSALYFTKIDHGEGYLFASNIASLVDILELRTSLNWTYLVSFVASNHQVTSVTPFNNIYEILPGCVTTLHINEAPKLSQFWDPTVISSTHIENEADLEEKIFETAQKTLSAWVSSSNKIHIELSGGLDSSSLLGMLKHSGYCKPIQAVNFFDSSLTGSDEREYASDVCNIYQVPLNFIDSKELLPFSETSLSTRFDRPSSSLLDTNISRNTITLMNISKDDEILSGQGGDHLFFASPPQEAFVDYLLEKGFSSSSFVLKDLCAFNRMPYPSFLKDSLFTYLNYKLGRINQFPLTCSTSDWMNDSFKYQVNQNLFRPFYWENLKNVYPGKAQHILAILSSTLYIDRGHYFPGKSVINPLLSQPLIELALSIPSYQSYKHGYNRYHYRKAMERHLKGRFLWRISKGEISGQLIAGARKNFAVLRALLLDGNFSQKGYIDTDNLNRSLLEFKSGKTDALWPLLNLFVAEKWIDSWKRKL